MSKPLLIRFKDGQKRVRLGLLQDEHIADITEYMSSLTEWLRASVTGVEDAIVSLQQAADQSKTRISLSDIEYLPPVETGQEIWASGVTYARSRSARQEESQDGGDVYARVYSAKRPELFFKARGAAVIGHLGQVGIRSDATWSVPEPELTLVLNPALEVIGCTVGNDMSSRDIEGENPLYLPQAKVYTASCALGPCIALGNFSAWTGETIAMKIDRESSTVFEQEISTTSIHRTLEDLVRYLGQSNTYPDGVLLMTGTGIVPPSDFSLRAGDKIHITIDGIGTLSNTVIIV